MQLNWEFPTRETCVIADLLERQAADRPDRPYVIFGDEATWTFADAARHAWRMANALQAHGVQRGDRVSVWAPTRPELLQTWFGINAAGAIYAPLNLAARGMFLEHALNVAEPRILVAHGGLAERLAGLDVPSLEKVVLIGEAPDGLDLPWEIVPFETFVAGAAETRPVLDPPLEPWDEWGLVYTSGTTGPSKGVRLAYASLRLYGDGLLWADIGEDDRYLMTLPLSHVAGTSTVYGMLHRGGAVVLPGAFDAKTYWDEVRRHGVTASFIIHGMVSFLLAQEPRPDDADSPLKWVYMGPLGRVEEFRTRFGVSIYTGFGMTETPLCLRSELNPTSETIMGAPFNPDFEFKVVDEHDIEVPDGTPGEMLIRNRHAWVMNLGYRGMPEATADAWRMGWFHTGDQVLVDGDGNFVFVDRVKDAIRRRGENISSYEVEAEVLTFEGVDQVAAIAVPAPEAEHTSGDEEVMIVVVPAAGKTVDPLELTEYLIPRMPRHMVPRFVRVAKELPLTPSFKIKKNELRQEGVTADTWDREAAGIRLKREQLV